MNPRLKKLKMVVENYYIEADSLNNANKKKSVSGSIA